MTTFHERLITLHRELDMSQDATVDAIKRVTGFSITQGTFSNYLRNTEPDVTPLRAIAKFYGVSTAWLTGETDDRRPLHQIIARLDELSFDANIITAAEILQQMPVEERAETITMIQARHRQWATMENLIRVIEQFDNSGTLKRRVAELSGIDITTSQARSEFVADDLLSNGNTHGIGEQLALLG